MLAESRDDDCPEERIARRNSPFGTVKDDEMLVRFVCKNEHCIGEDNSILMGALQEKEFCSDGWSLLREGHADVAKGLKEFANNNKKSVEDYGYALVKAADVRQILDKEQRRAICVIDDPQPENPAHALARRARDYEKHAFGKIRKNLRRKFSEVMFVSDITEKK